MSPPPIEEQVLLADQLRSSSSEQHHRAEQREFIVDLLSGDLSLDDYTRYLAQLARVYEALEQLVSRVSAFDPAGCPFEALFDPRLARLEVIENDLAALEATHWRRRYPALPATDAYLAHLRALTGADGVRALAHHYTRYLGDLSGGQAIARLVARHYGATAEQLGFYRFDALGDIVAYKRRYRENLNALRLTPAQVGELVAEVDSAFTLNGALFDELAA